MKNWVVVVKIQTEAKSLEEAKEKVEVQLEEDGYIYEIKGR